jgi:2-iminoacetate synthase
MTIGRKADMRFYPTCLHYEDFQPDTVFKQVGKKDVELALGKDTLGKNDFLALLSPAAENYIESMAQKAHQLTVQNFGKVIQLYTPMYLSNFCSNQCLYCGFNTHNQITRKQLSLEEVEKEASEIAKTGLKHILILTGGARKIATPEYIKHCVHIIANYFTSICIEVYELETEEYDELIKAGVDCLTIYQETYNTRLYKTLHPKGPKQNFEYRLTAPDRAAKAGIRSINIGALLGLDDWRREAFLTGLHGDYIQRCFPEVELGVSLPRIKSHEGSFQPSHVVTDRNFVQIMLAFRLFLPRAGITISTREPALFRDNIIRLGATKMSAGSSTKVGGWTSGDKDTGQFDISDHRSVQEIKEQIQSLGYQPVFKDWQSILDKAV